MYVCMDVLRPLLATSVRCEQTSPWVNGEQARCVHVKDISAAGSRCEPRHLAPPLLKQIMDPIPEEQPGDAHQMDATPEGQPDAARQMDATPEDQPDAARQMDATPEDQPDVARPMDLTPEVLPDAPRQTQPWSRLPIPGRWCRCLTYNTVRNGQCVFVFEWYDRQGRPWLFHATAYTEEAMD